jgi:hypothetical protein
MTEPKDPRPKAGYTVLLCTYALVASLLAWALRNRRAQYPFVGLGRFIVFALATQHLSRLVTKDSITSPLRAPFTRFLGPAGEGEVNEEVIGTGLRHAIGELLTCPYCIGQWVASGLVAGLVATPEAAEAFATACALARVSDYLQLAYDRLNSDA